MARPPALASVILVASALLLSPLAPPIRAQSHPEATSLPDTLTFERATALLAAHSPVLRATAHRVRADARAAEHRARFPNPSVSVLREWTDLEAGTDDQWFASISQPLRYPGEHRAYGHVARATEAAAQADVQEVQAQLLRTLRHRYLDVIEAQTRLEVLTSVAASVRTAARTAQVRYEEGDLGSVERSRLQVAQARYDDDLAEARRRHRDARVELAYLLLPDAEATLDAVRPQLDFHLAPPADLRMLSVRARPVDEQAILNRALHARGLLEAARARVEARSADVRVARYRRLPSLELSGGPRSQSVPGSTTYGYTAGLRVGLPLWNRGGSAVEAERGRQQAAQADLEVARRRVEVQVHDAVERVESYRDRIQQISQSVLQTTDSLKGDARFVYQEGELTLFELIDAVDAARDATLLRTTLRAAYLRALYDLEFALGVGLDDASPLLFDPVSPRTTSR